MLKKLLITISIVLLLILACVYGLLFTSSGNGIIANYIENKVNDEQKNVRLKVNNFKLTFDNINFNATINDNSNININGPFALLKKRVDLKYDIKINDLSKLKNLIGREYKGPFATSGTFVGNEKLATIKGISNFASSDTKYNFKLEDFVVKKIWFSVKNAKLEELLVMFNEPLYAKGRLSLKGSIKDADLNKLDGKVYGTISKGKLNNEVVNKILKQNILTRVYFKADVNAKLLPNKVELKSSLISSLFDVFTQNTKVDLKTGNILSDYKMDVKNLSKFQSMIGQKLNGGFSTSGNASYKNKVLKLNGISNLLDSKTTYILNYKNQKPDLMFMVKEAKLDKVFYTFDTPVFARGNLTIDGNISDLRKETLKGSITTKLTDAKVVKPVVNTVYKQKLKKDIYFSGNARTVLDPKKARTSLNINSKLANLEMQALDFVFKTAALQSNYKLKIPSLEALNKVSDIKLRGDLDVDGTFSLISKAMAITGKSKLFDGNVDFNLKNDNLKLKAKDVTIDKITHMLYYPKVFTSKGDLDLKYNLLYKRGKAHSYLRKGHFLSNNFTKLIKQFSKFDLTKEVYESIDIHSGINDNIITSLINMQSRKTKIDINKSILDLNKKTIDTDINANINKVAFKVNVKGNIKKPKVTLDSKMLIKSQIEKQIDKKRDKITEKLNKMLNNKLDKDEAKKVLEGIKGLF